MEYILKQINGINGQFTAQNSLEKKASIQFNIYLEVLKLDFPLIVDVGDHGRRSR